MEVVSGSEVLYRPSPWQQEFHALPHDEVLGAGAAGVGKSFALKADPIAQIMVEHQRCSRADDHRFPLEWGTSRGWALFLRRTEKSLRQAVGDAHRLFNALDPNVAWNERHQMFTFASGYKYQFGHCRNPTDWTGYLSWEFTRIMYDELIEFEEEQYSQINMRLRTTDPVLSHMLGVRSCSNPSLATDIGTTDGVLVKDPMWVRRYFVEPWREGRRTLSRLVKIDGLEKKFTRIFLPGTIDDNPDPAFVAQYKLRLASAKPHIRQAFLYGDWWITVGSFFAEAWNKNLHVCDSFKIPLDWKVFRSMDWGYRAPGCVHWWALSPEDELYCIKEVVFQGRHDIDVAKMILQVEKDLNLDLVDRHGKSRITGPADTQIWEERGQSAKTIAQVFFEAGVPWVKADKTSRQANANRVYKRLDSHEGGTVRPGLIFFRNCRKIIELLPAIQTNPKNTEEPVDGGYDHPIDSCFYGVANVSHGPGTVSARTKEKDPWDDEDRAGPKAKGAWWGNAWN